MKPPEEIKKGMRFCMLRWTDQHYASCHNECHYRSEGLWCRNVMNSDALTYIAQLESDNDAKQKRIEELESRLAQVERERDAAVRIVHGLCLHCKNDNSEGETCRECIYYPYRYVYGTGETYVDNWEWRGVCAENTEEEE